MQMEAWLSAAGMPVLLHGGTERPGTERQAFGAFSLCEAEDWIFAEMAKNRGGVTR